MLKADERVKPGKESDFDHSFSEMIGNGLSKEMERGAYEHRSNGNVEKVGKGKR